MDRAEFIEQNFEEIKTWIWFHRREELIAEMVEADLWSDSIRPLIRNEGSSLPLSQVRIVQSGSLMEESINAAVEYLAFNKFYDEEYEEWRSRQ